MNEIFITDASAVFAEKLTLDETIIKGDKFYFGKLEKDFEPINDKRYDLRCNRILKYLVDKLNLSGFEKNEIGIVIGTTNSGIEEFEITENKLHAELGNPAEFLKWYLGTTNYTTCVSTACTSGAKAFSTARKLLQNGVCRAVIAGGVDTLASMPSYGFHALEVLSHEKTNPFSKNRNGISLGEGGALFLLALETDGGLAYMPNNSSLGEVNFTTHQNNSKETDPASKHLDICAPCHQNNNTINQVAILGIGETSDAYHAATPDPNGTQAVKAIQKALNDANLNPEDIDYINLHGTGTISNDLMEANVIYKVFGDKIPTSSTKPLTGHCLGAAASIEAFICYQILKGERNLPIHQFDGEYDETLPKINLVNEKTPQKDIKTCMSTSFGFGGTNAAVILATKYNLDTQKPSCLAATCLPHSTPMVLIDEVLDVDMEKQIVKTSVKIHEDKIFFDKEINGISPLVGIEFMAQTIGCYAYFKGGKTIPKVGFLLGTRQYENLLEKFENGKTYIMTAQEIYGDNELVSFECLIYNENEDTNLENYVSKATINAFQPKDVEKYIKELE